MITTEFNDDKKNAVYELLTMPICCDKEVEGIYRKDNVIYSGQKYDKSADPDMSDFAAGFYEILYKDLLSEPLLKESGKLNDVLFAGDTMNSFNTVANITPGAGNSSKNRTPQSEWPEYLIKYCNFYHCLANFWLIPLEMGRTLEGSLNKASAAGDYMDRFISLLIKEAVWKNPYFITFGGRDNFIKKHFLNAYISYGTGNSEDLAVNMYSYDKNPENIISAMTGRIKQRARDIAESEFAPELWTYFENMGITD